MNALRRALMALCCLLAALAPAEPTPAPALATATASTTNTRSIVAPARRDVPGLRAQSPGGGALYAPPTFNPAAAQATHVVLFFHGAAWCAEQNFHDAAPNAVLVTLNAKDMAERLADPEALSTVLEETTTTLAQMGFPPAPLGRLVLSSFSGGYVSPRAILRHARWRARVTDLVLADSLYGPRLPDDPDRLDPAAMEPFVFFAKEAAEGRRTLLFSHLFPPEEQYRGNTTTLAANMLIEAIGATREPADAETSAGAHIISRAGRGNAVILGYAGMTNQDHFNHFYGISDLWRQLALGPAAPPETPRP